MTFKYLGAQSFKSTRLHTHWTSVNIVYYNPIQCYYILNEYIKMGEEENLIKKTYEDTAKRFSDMEQFQL